MSVPEHARVYLGLGSNLGDRVRYLAAAIRAVARLPHTAVLRCSSVYETSPWGVTGQRPYLNCAVAADTGFGPEDFLTELQRIERELGRTAAARYAPRVIDIDLLLFGDVIRNSDVLSLPHPRLPERRFVLEPLAEIAPDAVHPALGLSISELARTCRDSGSVTRIPARICP